MGEIVRNWLTFKLGLEIPSTSDPEDFRKELANGILFAEVLRKYGILSDDEFVSLRHNNSKKSRAKNMLAIQNWVTRSGMPISHGMLMGVAQEKLGAGVKFLYELYLWLEDGCRHPEIGARAKSFLQMRSFSTAWEGSKFGSNYRPSVAPSKLSEPIDFDPCIAIERKWERSLSLTDGDLLYPPDVDLDTRQPNWYTTLDPVPAPAMIVSTAPFKEVGEAAEAENKYFIEESVEILKRQQQLLEASQYRREKELAKMRFEPIPWESYTFCPAQGNCERRLRKLKEECLEVKQTWSEMDNFDKEKKLASKKAKCTNNKKQQIEPIRVYCDGRGDAEQLRKSVSVIKKRRQRMAEECEARAMMRRVTSKRLAQDVPCIMYYTMRDDVMGCISRLPSSERLLAEFIYQGHKQRESIIRHTIYEAGQLELAREFDLTKQFQAKLAEEELELELSEFKLEQPVRSLVDPDEEAIRLDNEAMAEALLKNLTRLVSKVAAYRSTAGRECLEHDIYPATLEEGIEAEYRVVLEGNEFVMEPSRWGGLAETTLREPDPPLLQLTPELTREDHKFLIKHIAVILDRFLQGESGSLIPARNFTAIIEDLILASIRCAEVEDRREYLPPAWLHLTPPLLNRLVSLLMGRRGFINWRNFIIACLDLPYPDQRELIAALQQFQDPSGLFCTDKNGFDQVTLWFETKKEDETHTLLDVFKALHVRECLFYMFADVQGHFYYVDFLLYFAKDTDPILGIVKALAVLTGRTIATSSFTKGATLAYIRGRTSESLLTDSDMDLFLEGTVVPQKRGSLVPPNSPKRKFDFSSRMAALRHRYQLFTSGPAPEAPPLMEPDQSDPNALLARLTEEEEKTLTSRLADSERKRKQKICAKIRREKHERHKLRHHHHRRVSGKSSLTSLESEVRLHDLDRLKLLFEKELEKEDEGETDSPDVETRSKSGREEVKSEQDPPQTPVSNLEPDEAAQFGISQSVMRIHPHARPEVGHSPSVMFIHGHTDDEAPHSGVTTAMAHQGGGESSPGSAHESRESQTQTDDEEEDGEYEGEFEEEWFEEVPELGATTIPSEAFLQAIWFGHITSFPVNDPSFMSADYFKYKEFLEVAYEELYEKAAMIDGEIYVSYLTQILEHPFVVEIIRRFATYRIVNLQKALNEVIASVAPKEASSSDPANELSTAFNPDEQAEDEIEGEYDESLMRVGSKVRIARTASTSKRGKRSRRRSSKGKSATDITKKSATRPATVKFGDSSSTHAPKNTDAQSTAASKKTKNSGKAEKKDKKRKK